MIVSKTPNIKIPVSILAVEATAGFIISTNGSECYITGYGLFISFILQSSSYYPFVTQAHTVIPASPLSDYQGISQLL